MWINLNKGVLIMEEAQEKIIIAYHANCSDGQAAGFVTWKATGRCGVPCAVNYDLHKKSFSDVLAFLTKSLDTGTDISQYRLYVVDFSFPVEMLVKLGEVFQSIVVLDHHLTSYEDLKSADFTDMSCIRQTQTNPFTGVTSETYHFNNIDVKFCMEESGALMAWNHFFGQDEKVPEFVQYISDRDLWKFVHPETKPFSEGIKRFKNYSWRTLEEKQIYEDYTTRIAEGTVLLEQLQSRIDSVMSKPAREFTAWVDGVKYRIGAYNAPFDITSDLLSQYVLSDKNPHKIGMTFTIGSDDKVYCSMRSTKDVDCSVIARALGGGGHAQACGFILGLEDFVRILHTGNLTDANVKHPK